MTGPEAGPPSGSYGGEGDSPTPQEPPAPQYGAAPQPPQYGEAPQPPQYGGPPPADAPTPPPDGTLPPYGQPPVVRNRKPLIIGGIIAVIVIIAVVITVALVGGGGSPKSVAEDYLNAGKRGDVSKLQSLTCDKFKDQVSKADVGGSDGIDSALANLNFEITNVQQSGDTAVVSVKITYTGASISPLTGTGGSVTVPLPLVKEHGSWKVCSD